LTETDWLLLLAILKDEVGRTVLPRWEEKMKDLWRKLDSYIRENKLIPEDK